MGLRELGLAIPKIVEDLVFLFEVVDHVVSCDLLVVDARFGIGEFEVGEGHEEAGDDCNGETDENGVCVEESALEWVLSIDVSTLGCGVVWLMRILVEPGVVVDHTII